MTETPARANSPMGDKDIESLQRALDALPPPLEPLDVGAIDGYLCGVLLQPQAVPLARWLPMVFDEDGRAPPAGAAVGVIESAVRRRHAELAQAIARRDWFDPWVFEIEAEESDETDPITAAVWPWVAGFALAMERFPLLMDRIDATGAVAPLSLIYRHVPPEDLEDADALIEEIETLEPCEDLAEAVEGLVRGTLLLADLAQGGPPKPPRRGPPPRRGARR